MCSLVNFSGSCCGTCAALSVVAVGVAPAFCVVIAAEVAGIEALVMGAVQPAMANSLRASLYTSAADRDAISISPQSRTRGRGGSAVEGKRRKAYAGADGWFGASGRGLPSGPI
jgi:hypothetical protein